VIKSGLVPHLAASRAIVVSVWQYTDQQ